MLVTENWEGLIEDSEKCFPTLKGRRTCTYTHTHGGREPFSSSGCLLWPCVLPEPVAANWPPRGWEKRWRIVEQKDGKTGVFDALIEQLNSPNGENSFISRLPVLWDNTSLFYFKSVESRFLWFQLKESWLVMLWLVSEEVGILRDERGERYPGRREAYR